METYSLRDIESMLGLSRAVITGLVAAGFVTPTRGKRREYRFSFQDIVLLRTAHSLQAAQIAPSKILRSLKRLRARLPSELPLTGLRITAVGNEIAVKEGQTQWQADSGQLLMDFELLPPQGTASVLSVKLLSYGAPQPAREPAGQDDPCECFGHGVELEASDPSGAERAYRHAIAVAPDYADPYLNLGVMLGEAGRGDEAVALYLQGLEHCPAEPLLHFNLGVALEDTQRIEDALACYERCLKLAPDFADAHYNAARLHEQLGHGTRAIRHYSEYRRLHR